MRLTTWNCNGGFSRKIGTALSLRPDVLIVPECGENSWAQQELGLPTPNCVEWIGNIPSKGLGVFSFGEHRISRADFYNPEHRLILPLEVRGPLPFLLLAVWTLPDENGSYVRPLLDAWKEYAPHFHDRDVIVAGDFNASVSLPGKPIARFPEFIDLAAKRDVVSLYHSATGEHHGSETSPTFFMYRHAHRPFHIDFIFAGKSVLSRLRSFEVGTHQDWSAHSDHVPLTVDFGTPSPPENV